MLPLRIVATLALLAASSLSSAAVVRGIGVSIGSSLPGGQGTEPDNPFSSPGNGGDPIGGQTLCVCCLRRVFSSIQAAAALGVFLRDGKPQNSSFGFFFLDLRI